MNLRKRKKPSIIKQLETLASRLPKSFPKLQIIERDIVRHYENYYVKQAVDHYLSYLPKTFTIINDVCLRNVTQFQIDSLILTPYALFIIQIEKINSHRKSSSKQASYINGKKINYYLSKAKNNQMNLNQWLKRYNFNHLPTYYLITFNNTSLPKFNYENYNKTKLVLAKHLPYKLTQFYKQLKGYHQNNKQSVQQLIKTIYTKREAAHFDVFNHYNINKNSIMTGVRCHQCHTLNMKRENLHWQCQICKYKLAVAHRETLNEYFTLLNKPISNRDCQWFLNIKSQGVVKQILQEEKLAYTSKQKMTRYT